MDPPAVPGDLDGEGEIGRQATDRERTDHPVATLPDEPMGLDAMRQDPAEDRRSAGNLDPDDPHRFIMTQPTGETKRTPRRVVIPDRGGRRQEAGSSRPAASVVSDWLPIRNCIRGSPEPSVSAMVIDHSVSGSRS